ncbi:hypothetical protein Hanom_Chr06g00558331 [Helianthus anomalus]
MKRKMSFNMTLCWPMISRSSGGGLTFLLRDASSTLTWCRVRHWWAMIGDPGKLGLDP